MVVAQPEAAVVDTSAEAGEASNGREAGPASLTLLNRTSYTRFYWNIVLFYFSFFL
jgi:hypothetical protein